MSRRHQQQYHLPPVLPVVDDDTIAVQQPGAKARKVIRTFAMRATMLTTIGHCHLFTPEDLPTHQLRSC
jgi:hypothetical protein